MLLLQSSTDLLLLLFLLLVASLGPALTLSFVESRQEAATRLVSRSSGCDVMPLWLAAVQKSEMCVPSIGSFQQRAESC